MISSMIPRVWVATAPRPHRCQYRDSVIRVYQPLVSTNNKICSSSAYSTFVSPLLHLAGDGMFLLRLAQCWLNPGVTPLPSSCNQTFSISIFQEPLIAAQVGTRCIYMCIVYLLLVKCCAVDVYRSAILNQMPSISFQSGPGMKAQPAEPLRRCKVSLYRFLCSVE